MRGGPTADPKGSGASADTKLFAAGQAGKAVRSSVNMNGSEELKSDGKLKALTLSTALEAMSTPPPVVVALNEVLRSNPIDLMEVGAVAHFHADSAARILNLCNSSIFSLPHPVSSLEQATVSLGAEVLRTLSLAWGLVEQVGKHLPPAEAHPFWQHSLTTALLSERIAEWMDYPVTEAYLAGFLHDIGRVPLLMAAGREERAMTCLKGAAESTEIEGREFGLDHCELGRRIGTSWRFSDLFVRVFSHHHGLTACSNEPELVRIVSTAEGFCARQTTDPEKASPGETGWRGQSHMLLSTCLPQLDTTEGMSLAEALELEFLQAAQGLQLGAPKPVPCALVR
jgi:putative nucleotidyltransferase with HDIG domain